MGSPDDLSAVRRRADEADLFRRWRTDGEERAHQELTSAYLPLAYKLASRYQHSPEPMEDLRQVAALGLIKALDRYDPAEGFAFSTFAVPTILGELRRHFRDHSWSVHVGRTTKELALKLRQKARELEQAGHRVTVPLLAEALDVSAEQVIEAWTASDGQHALSLDVPATDQDGESDGVTLGDQFAATESGFDDVDTADAFSRAAEKLTRRDQMAWRLYHEAGFNQREIADRLGVSQMQVSRILSRTAEQLRSSLPDRSE